MTDRNMFSEKRIAIVIFIIGLILSFMIPTWQTPDEHTHLGIIGRSLGNPKFAENICDSLPIKNGRVEGNLKEKPDKEKQKEALTEKQQYSRKDMLPGKVSLSVIKHVPSIIGMYLGILLGLPAYWVLQMGELFSLLLYTLICYRALKIMPVKKELMAMLMLLPMAVQQATSIGYDSIVISFCFFFVSYVFYLKYDKEVVGIKECVILLMTWAVISYVKLPYVFLALLVLLVPLEKFHIDLKLLKIDENFIKKIRIPCVLLICLLAAGGFYVFRENKFVQVVYGFLMEWKRGAYLLAVTGKTWWKFIVTSAVGGLGWLEVTLPAGAAALIYASLIGISFVDSGSEQRKMRIWDVLVLMAVCVILTVFTTMALTDHTIMVILYGDEWANKGYHIREALYQIPYIGGMQGRYYLPFLSLFFLLLPGKICVDKRIVGMCVYLLEAVLYIYVFFQLIQRYWIA